MFSVKALLAKEDVPVVMCPGEPSAPKLEAKVQKKGNALKVNWVKQDDGGTPIKHYLVRYKPVSIPGAGRERGAQSGRVVGIVVVVLSLSVCIVGLHYLSHDGQSCVRVMCHSPSRHSLNVSYLNMVMCQGYCRVIFNSLYCIHQLIEKIIVISI